MILGRTPTRIGGEVVVPVVLVVAVVVVEVVDAVDNVVVGIDVDDNGDEDGDEEGDGDLDGINSSSVGIIGCVDDTVSALDNPIVVFLS